MLADFPWQNLIVMVPAWSFILVVLPQMVRDLRKMFGAGDGEIQD